MKKLSVGILGIYVLCLGIFTYAQQGTRGEFGRDPIQILDTVKDKANDKKGNEIQDTALDETMDQVSGDEHRLLATLEAVNKKINVYFQWMTYVGLSIATILLIFNGFMMVTHAIHNSGDIATTKKNISRIIIGVILMLGFWAVIKLILAVINMLFGLSD